MTPERLLELYHEAWQRFYRDEPQTHKMYKLLRRVTEREMADGTFVPRRSDRARERFGRGPDGAAGHGVPGPPAAADPAPASRPAR